MTDFVKPAVMLVMFVSASELCAQDDSRGRLVFHDDFERVESQELKDEIGNGWNTNSDRRAAGNKQADLKHGTLVIKRHPQADHAVSVTHPIEFTNGTVEVRFQLDDEDDNLGINFADLQYKKVWAGHLFVARVSPKWVQLQDLKTGNMDLQIRKLRQAKQLTEEQKEMLAEKSKRVAHTTSLRTWHLLRVDVDGEVLKVLIDGQRIAQLSSAGIQHAPKRLLRLSVPREANVDEIKVYSRDPR